MLSEEMVEKFRELYRAQFGEDISKKEALAQGTVLLNMVKIIYQPLPKKQISKSSQKATKKQYKTTEKQPK